MFVDLFLLQDGESGWSSLHRALHFGHLAMASILLQSGASIMLEDSKSRTPIDLLSGPVSHDSGMFWFLEFPFYCYVRLVVASVGSTFPSDM